MADDIGGIVIPNEFEIAMIRTQPTINDVSDLDFVCGHQNVAGRFLTPVSGIRFHPNAHGSYAVLFWGPNRHFKYDNDQVCPVQGSIAKITV
jgi:hypothetical protein